MDVYLPARLNRMTMYNLIGQVINSDLQPCDDTVNFDFEYLNFIEPVGFTVLSNLVEWLKKRGVRVLGTIPSRCNSYRRSCAICFLDDSLFFERYVGKKIFNISGPRDTTIPLTNVTFQGSAQWLEFALFWLSGRLQLTTSSLTNIKVCFEEIFNNINDHSTENIGCVFAQHYPNKNEIRVAISDFGVGIPYNVQKVKPALSDGQSIKLATQYGFTTRSNPRNGGRGLNTLIHNVVENNRGNVYIHSNRGILISTYNNDRIHYETRDNIGFYPGTLLDIVFRTDTIDNNEEEDFSW